MKRHLITAMILLTPASLLNAEVNAEQCQTNLWMDVARIEFVVMGTPVLGASGDLVLFDYELLKGTTKPKAITLHDEEALAVGPRVVALGSYPRHINRLVGTAYPATEEVVSDIKCAVDIEGRLYRGELKLPQVYTQNSPLNLALRDALWGDSEDVSRLEPFINMDTRHFNGLNSSLGSLDWVAGCQEGCDIPNHREAVCRGVRFRHDMAVCAITQYAQDWPYPYEVTGAMRIHHEVLGVRAYLWHTLTELAVKKTGVAASAASLEISEVTTE